MDHVTLFVHLYAFSDACQQDVYLGLLDTFVSQVLAVVQHLSVEWNAETDLQSEIFCSGVFGVKRTAQIERRENKRPTIAIVTGVVTLGAVGPLVDLDI